MCCTRLAGNAGPKKSPKIRHLGTIAQLCRAISLHLRHVSTIGKNLVNSNARHMSSQYSELRPTSGWDLLASLGHPTAFQQVSRLGSVTARHSSSRRQSNCGVEQRAPPIFGMAAITLGILHWLIALSLVHDRYRLLLQQLYLDVCRCPTVAVVLCPNGWPERDGFWGWRFRFGPQDN